MRKKAIGIDLGTTNSVMAVVREDMPEIIPMGTNDDQVLRSAVYFSKTKRFALIFSIRSIKNLLKCNFRNSWKHHL